MVIETHRLPNVFAAPHGFPLLFPLSRFGQITPAPPWYSLSQLLHAPQVCIPAAVAGSGRHLEAKSRQVC
jgi:hypothetical protein